jgi:tRNA(Arg) A34 adenosine deaminase TadA
MSLKEATLWALVNPVEGLPRMAAIICNKKKHVISVGWNSRKSDPLAAKYGRHPDAIYPHAELAAIKNALRDRNIQPSQLQDCTMYVARVKRDGTPAMAKPCVGCQRAIQEFGIGDVQWTT